MSYIALYRKFRPQTFDQIKGQDHVVTALKNQLRKGRIGHSYLFTGTRGTGKTSAARILAKAVNCQDPHDGEPCNACPNCLAVNAGNFVDVVEVDAASNNGVDDIRRLIEEVRYTPVRGKYKVYIIDEAHMITGAAFNAFLKTLEEPPAYAVFILATTEPHKLPVTILSRCQRYDFRRITTEEIAGNLAEIAAQEGVQTDEKALRYIARAGDGSMRDSISLLDKCIAFNLGDALTYDRVLDTLGSVDTEVFSALYCSVYRADVGQALCIIDQAAADGRDLTQFAVEWIRYIRNLLMIRTAGIHDPDVLGVSAENMERMNRDAADADPTVLMRYIHELSELLNRMRYSSARQILLETTVIRLATPRMETDICSLADRVRQLENLISQTSAPLPPADVPDSRQTPVYSTPGRGETASSPGLADNRLPDGMTDPDIFADLIDIPPQDALYQEAPHLETSPGPTPQDAAAVMKTSEKGVSDIWSSMANACKNGRIRAVMKKCTAAMLPSGSGSGILRIYAPSIMVYNQLQEEETKHLLQKLAAESAGQPIEIQILKEKEDTAGTVGSDTGFPEDLLKNIHMKIGTEEY